MIQNMLYKLDDPSARQSSNIVGTRETIFVSLESKINPILPQWSKLENQGK